MKTSERTDNKTANMKALIPWMVAATFAFIHIDYFRAFSPVLLVSLFTVSYIISSWWFSPDLDCSIPRNGPKSGLDSLIPGLHSFPFGPLMKLASNYGLGFLARWLHAPHYLFNRMWRVLWFFFGIMFTHRGVVHWPFYGAFLRLSYVYTVGYVFYALVALAMGSSLISYGDGYLMMWAGLMMPLGAPVLAGIIISDITHSAVDLSDSVARGTKFCSIKNKPGKIRALFSKRGLS